MKITKVTPILVEENRTYTFVKIDTDAGHYGLGEAGLGRRAQAPFGLTFTTVDIALTPDGPIVFEFSAFGGYRGAQEGCGIDAAALVADHVLEQVRA